ncbi:MAG: alpha-galactosidase [Verrucomicrobiaceae bacterium]|nr:alpha-galactosidase [Verrucomicrobiaceae bacterium]
MTLVSRFLFAIILTTWTVVVHAAAPSVEHAATGADYSLRWDGDVRISEATFALKINGMWVYGDAFPKRVWSAENGRQVLRCSGLAPVEEFVLTIETANGRPYAVVSAALKSSADFKLGGVRVLTKKGDAQNLSVPTPEKGWTVFVEALRAPDHGRIYTLKQLAELKSAKKSGDARDAFWVSTLQNDAKNQTLAFAALKGELWPTSFEWRSASEGALNVSLRSSSPLGLEEIVVHPGRLVEVDPVMIGYWDDRRPTKVLDEVGRIMGESIRQGRPMHGLEPGWSSWHSYDRFLSAEDVLKAARFMKAELYDAGYRYIQLDGGWWTEPGSYYVNKDFPRGIRDLSNQITDMGLKFGLHISPFRISPKDPYWNDHADWVIHPFVKEKIGKNDDDMIATKGMVYLDGSHPDVAPYLAGQFKQMVESYKPTFMKWDHHYGSLEEGPHFDPTMTGLQAHNKTVRIIRAALPSYLVVTRSMGWLFGALECYDALRIGNDINHPGIKSAEEPYANMTYGKTSGSIENVLEGKDYKGMIRFARRSGAELLHSQSHRHLRSRRLLHLASIHARGGSLPHHRAGANGWFHLRRRPHRIPAQRSPRPLSPQAIAGCVEERQARGAARPLFRCRHSAHLEARTARPHGVRPLQLD